MGLFGSQNGPQPPSRAPEVPPGLEEIEWTSVGPHLIGRTLHVQYDTAERYEGGVLAGYASDFSKIVVRMQDGNSSTGLRDSRDNPRLYVRSE